MQLTSSRNPRLQSIRRAAAAGKPTDDGLVVAEGPHLLEEALKSGSSRQWAVEQVFATPEARSRFPLLLAGDQFEIVDLAARAMDSTTATENPQGVLALLRPPVWTWDDVIGDQNLPLVILDAMQDPGNAGTLVRSAEAFGASGLVFSQGSARVSNGKFLRGTAGSIFRLPYLEEADLVRTVERVLASGRSLYALTPNGTRTLLDTSIGSRCALVIGSEGRGISNEVLARAQTIRIPTSAVESLNAAVAGSIALFEAQRQRAEA